MNDPSVREFSGSFAQVRPRRRGRPVDLHGGMTWTPSNDVGQHTGMDCQALYEDAMGHSGAAAADFILLEACEKWYGEGARECDELEDAWMSEKEKLSDAVSALTRTCPPEMWKWFFG